MFSGKIIFFLLLFSSSIAFGCSGTDLKACETLTASFIKSAEWGNARALGEALCKKDIVKGCTYAGTAAIALGKTKVGVDFLAKGCDGFEPYACLSLSDLMKQTGDDKMPYMYQKRACYFGLSESCKKLNRPKNLYSQGGEIFLKSVLKDCDVTTSESCKGHLKSLASCPAPLTKDDCFLIPGDLSITFRAKLIQEVAKLLLLNILASEKLQKENTKIGRYSYDLGVLMKDHKPQATYHYAFGFQRSCTIKFERKNAPNSSLGLYKKAYETLSSRTKRNISAFFDKEKASDCYDPKIGFEAFAAANLDPMNPARLDLWKINRDGNIIQIQNGLPGWDM